jgi:hypothetical protein
MRAPSFANGAAIGFNRLARAAREQLEIRGRKQHPHATRDKFALLLRL